MSNNDCKSQSAGPAPLHHAQSSSTGLYRRQTSSLLSPCCPQLLPPCQGEHLPTGTLMGGRAMPRCPPNPGHLHPSPSPQSGQCSASTRARPSCWISHLPRGSASYSTTSHATDTELGLEADSSFSQLLSITGIPKTLSNQKNQRLRREVQGLIEELSRYLLIRKRQQACAQQT